MDEKESSANKENESEDNSQLLSENNEEF